MMLRSKLLTLVLSLLSGVGMAEAQSTQPTTAPVQTAAGGTIVKIDGPNVVVKTQSGEVVLATDEHSIIRIDRERATLDSLKARMRVQAHWLSAKDGHPRRLLINALSPELGGKIVEISDKEILLRQRINNQQYVDIPVSFDQATKITINERVDGKLTTRIGTANDLKPGMQIWVRPDTGTAKAITTLSQENQKPEINPEL